MYLYREYFKAKVYTIWVHGPLGEVMQVCEEADRPSSEVALAESKADPGPVDVR